MPNRMHYKTQTNSARMRIIDRQCAKLDLVAAARRLRVKAVGK